MVGSGLWDSLLREMKQAPTSAVLVLQSTINFDLMVCSRRLGKGCGGGVRLESAVVGEGARMEWSQLILGRGLRGKEAREEEQRDKEMDRMSKGRG